jgi:methylmalonyl-CoA mutase
MTASNPASADTNESLSHAAACWRATVDAELKGASFDKKFVTRTPDGIALQPLYTRASLEGIPALETTPGEAPFLRGTRPLGYKAAGWLLTQEIAAASTLEFNLALRHDMMNGQNAVVLAPRSTAHDGVTGLALDSMDDVARALKGVDLTAVPVFLDAGADPLPMASLYLASARDQGTPWSKLSGSISADPLGEWIECGALPTSLSMLYDALAEWTGWAGKYLPGIKTIGVDARVWGNAGGTATQELAFALAASVEYLRALETRGVPAALTAARMEFRFAVGSQFFTEIAKFRAFRPLWARVVTSFKVAAEAAALANVRAATGRWDKTLLDPHVNMLRVTTQALSAALGGCDGLHIAPFDEVAGSVTDFSRRIARNVHVLLAEEFDFDKVADPAGGSWYIEKLTDQLARNAWALFQDIEQRGGLAAALRTGYPQQLAGKAAAEKRDGIARRRVGIVGTNLFPNLKETPLAIRDRVPAGGAGPEVPEQAAVPGTGDWSARFTAALSLAREGGTLTQLNQLSHGDCPAEVRIVAVTPWRASEKYEGLRARSLAMGKRTGVRPGVFLAKIGPPLQHKARADFSAGFFAAGGFETTGKQSFDTAEAAAAAAVASGAPIVVLCSTDETYPALVPAFVQCAKAGAPKLIVVLAGLPALPATVAAYREAGVDEFIHVRADVSEVLGKFLTQIEGVA